MKKAEFIERYGEDEYKKRILEQSKDWQKAHPIDVQMRSREQHCKGGKYYEKKRLYEMNGIPHARELIRKKHQREWSPCKRIVAPDSQIHHQWVPNTADYTGIALVEKDQHMYGFIDVIQILEGEITLLTEEEVRMGGAK